MGTTTAPDLGIAPQKVGKHRNMLARFLIIAYRTPSLLSGDAGCMYSRDLGCRVRGSAFFGDAACY